MTEKKRINQIEPLVEKKDADDLSVAAIAGSPIVAGAGLGPPTSDRLPPRRFDYQQDASRNRRHASSLP